MKKETNHLTLSRNQLNGLLNKTLAQVIRDQRRLKYDSKNSKTFFKDSDTNGDNRLKTLCDDFNKRRRFNRIASKGSNDKHSMTRLK